MMDALTGGDPAVYAELEHLRAVNGTITTNAVLERAADPASPLHQHFEWDDTAAAARYRLQQAGALIRRFRIVRPAGDRVISVPAYVRTGKGYEPVQTVMTQDLLHAQHRARLLLSMRRLADELRSWDEYREIVDLLDQVTS